MLDVIVPARHDPPMPRHSTFRKLCLIVLCLPAALCGAEDPPQLPTVPPREVGASQSRLDVIDGLVEKQIADGELAGAVVLVGFRGKIIFRRAYGDRQVEPAREPMTVDTAFDLASLTKPIATATSVMILVDEGRIDLDAPVAKYLPGFGSNGKEQITVRDLLTHQGGLIADNSIKDYAEGIARSWENILGLTPVAERGTRFIYSDMGFVTLGKLVETVSGKPLDEFVRERIYVPLGMKDTMYRPVPDLAARCAATEQRDGKWMKGDVHDPRAWALGGVAGHAGLFSTADDLARYAQMIVNGGEYGGRRILSAAIVDQMKAPQKVPSGVRGLGWDKQTSYSSNRGDLFTAEAIGHGGFTGTGIWIDPPQQLFVIFLSTRLHPDGKGTVNPLIGRIGTVAAGSVPFAAN
jgi:CubicO group peptidase (beta-lactamase class C family)